LKNLAFDAREKLTSDLKNNRLSHAYIVISNDAYVRNDFLDFASVLLGGAARYDGANLKVADIAEITDDAAVMPMDGGRKVYIIDNAERLRADAQNKLLKTYEEPPAYVTVILGASSPYGLLNTILSRGKKIYLESAKVSECAEVLRSLGVEKDKADFASTLADGNIEKAKLFAEDEAYLSLYGQTVSVIANLKASSNVAELLYSPPFTTENIASTLDFLDIILGDIMKITAKMPPRTFNADILEAAKRYSSLAASVAISAVNEARARLKANVGAISVGEYVLFSILEAIHKWR